MFARFALACLLAASCGLAAAAPTLTASTFNSGAPVDEAALGRRIPLVLVHGLGGSGQGWENFLQAYSRMPAWRAAFKPYTFRYASNASEVLANPALPRTINGLGAALRDALQAHYDAPSGFGHRSMVILAHSMGGLVARSMMQEHSFADGRRGGDRVLQLVTLGTPHQGSPLADAAGAFGVVLGEEFAHAYAGFVSGLAWTNFDNLNQQGRLCNAWLARLNSFWPAGSGSYGNCGNTTAVPLKGYYDRITAYAARKVQVPDVQIGYGVFEPGSSPALLVTHTWLKSSLWKPYENDGVVPYDSARFHGGPVAARKDAHQCDHRYIERGYTHDVKTPTASFSGWAFCASTSQGVVPSGGAGGWSVGNTIAADIAASFVTTSQVQRVLDWAESAFAAHLAPAGAVTDLHDGYLFRHYPATQAYVGVKDGNVFYIGPASAHQLLYVGTLAQLLAQAEAAGY